MPKNLFLIFNHHFTEKQKEDAEGSLQVGRIISMPSHLQTIWSDIPPDLPELTSYIAPVREWLSEAASPGDFVLIQGDFGATYLMVRFAFSLGLVPIYSTTWRRAEEVSEPDGSIKLIHHFEHNIFRRYGV